MKRLKLIIGWIGNNAERITTVVAILTAVGAALGWLIDSYSKRAEERVTRSMEYVDKFQSTEISSSYERLFSLMEKIGPELCRAKGPAINDLIDKAVSQNQAEPHIRKLLNYYTLTSMCTVNKICDRDTSCSVFYQNIDSFVRDFYVIFVKYKKQWGQDFVKELIEFRKYCEEGPWPWSTRFSAEREPSRCQ
jgi:hypothetical protein